MRVFDVETANVVKIYAHLGRVFSTKRQDKFGYINGVIRQASVAGYAMLCHAFAVVSLQAGGPGGHWEGEASRGATGNGYSKMVDDVMHGTAQDIGLISESLRSWKKHLKQFLKASEYNKPKSFCWCFSSNCYSGMWYVNVCHAK